MSNPLLILSNIPVKKSATAAPTSLILFHLSSIHLKTFPKISFVAALKLSHFKRILVTIFAILSFNSPAFCLIVSQLRYTVIPAFTIQPRGPIKNQNLSISPTTLSFNSAALAFTVSQFLYNK